MLSYPTDPADPFLSHKREQFYKLQNQASAGRNVFDRLTNKKADSAVSRMSTRSLEKQETASGVYMRMNSRGIKENLP